jgi:hypothetical protein
MAQYTLRAGSTYLITTYGTSTNSLASIGGSSELFGKIFHSNIIVEAQDNRTSTFKGNLQVNELFIISGSLRINNPLTITGSTTISSQDTRTVYLVSTTGSAVNITLPIIGAPDNGRILIFKKIGGTNSLTLDGPGTTPIDGNLTISTTDASASIQLLFQNNSIGWYIISQYGTWT